MLWTWGLKGDGLKARKDPVTLQIWSWTERHFCRTWVSSVLRSNWRIFQIQENKPKALPSQLFYLLFTGAQKPKEQSKKEHRSMLKHEVVPLGGFDCKINKPLLQNEKLQDFNYLITADSSKSRNLFFFFPFKRYWIEIELSVESILQFVKVKIIAPVYIFTNSDSNHICTNELIITDNPPPQKHSGIKTTYPELQSVISHKNKNDCV